MIKCIHQIVPHLGLGDAIGNQVREFRRLLRAWGYESEIFANTWDPSLKTEVHGLEAYQPGRPETVAMLHYAVCSPANELACAIPDRLAVYYHNVTPPEFYHRYDPVFAACLAEARSGLKNFATRGPAIAASAHNATELEANGFDVLAEVPYILMLERLRQGSKTADAEQLRAKYAAAGIETWLYVGRMVPNKRIEDVVLAFDRYHETYNRDSRLLLVGSDSGLPAYDGVLRALVTERGLDQVVTFAGAHNPESGLGVFYELADLYICLSEHEGFCVPLVEAMSFDLPVVGYASTGVPGTLGRSGVLLRRKTPALVAATAHEIHSDTRLRQAIVAGQRSRLDAFAPDVVRGQFRAAIDKLAAYPGWTGHAVVDEAQ